MSSVSLVAEEPRGFRRQPETGPHRGRQVLRALLEAEGRDRSPVIAEKPEDELRALLAHLAQHPADRLPDEELTLIEHPGCEPGEEGEVPRPARERSELREKGGTPDPKAAIAGPARQPCAARRVALQECADNVRGEPVHMGPGVRAPHETDEPRQVGLAEQRRISTEERDRDRAVLV